MLVLWKCFQVLVLWKMRFRSTFKYTTSDFTGISKSSSITKARLRLAFSKALGLGNAGQVLSRVFELLLPNLLTTWASSANATSKRLVDRLAKRCVPQDGFFCF